MKKLTILILTTSAICIFIMMTLLSCTTQPVASTPEPIAGVISPLSWEAGHPERAPWSDAILMDVLDNLNQSYSKASDIKTFCPKYMSIAQVDRARAWGELFVGIIYYESSFNPASASVDVGKVGDKNTYSVGLFQMSVVDQVNYGFKFGYTYADLLKPIPNINLALAIFKRQLDKYGVIGIPVGSKGLYWATIHPGGKYDNTKDIAARVQKYVEACK